MTLIHLTEPNVAAMLLEATMLICFGIAWPLANLRMIRSGRIEGTGVAFTAIILSGYVAGAFAKLTLAMSGHSLPPVFWLYVLNIGSVGLNLTLQWRLQHAATPGIGRPRFGAAVFAGRRAQPFFSGKYWKNGAASASTRATLGRAFMRPR